MDNLRILLLVLILGISGCGLPSKSIRYESLNRLPKESRYSIEIFDSMSIKKPCKVIGVVQVSTSRMFPLNILELHPFYMFLFNAIEGDRSQKAIAKIKREAATLGGDALLDLRNQPIGAGVISDGQGAYSGQSTDLWSAKVIVWDDSPHSNMRQGDHEKVQKIKTLGNNTQEQ